jgi:NAD(P)-dependent dehydrogenase (short-subunit alcohol dehydrogenase family)
MGIAELLSLRDKVAIVTGASRGLGQAFASALAEAGAHVAVTSRHASELESAAAAVRALGREALAIEADITREDQVRAMAARVVERFGRIDILVNNAAMERQNVPPEETSLESWSSVMRTNVDGTFLCAREVGRVMIGQKRGRIINMASLSGQVINRYFHGGSYDVSKSAVVALTKALAVEWAPHNITVNAIAPGYYGTTPNMRWFQSNPEIHRKVLELIPLGRLGTIEELAGLVVVMASDICAYMTGSMVLIDGGYTAW